MIFLITWSLCIKIICLFFFYRTYKKNNSVIEIWDFGWSIWAQWKRAEERGDYCIRAGFLLQIIPIFYWGWSFIEHQFSQLCKFQSPKSETLNDWYRMIWQLNIAVIVCLIPLSTKEDCAKYFERKIGKKLKVKYDFLVYPVLTFRNFDRFLKVNLLILAKNTHSGAKVNLDKPLESYSASWPESCVFFKFLCNLRFFFVLSLHSNHCNLVEVFNNALNKFHVCLIRMI